MEEKKYIDRLYQEKFKDFEAAPRKDLWKDIATQLKDDEKKRKSRVFPFWSRIAGAAAILTFILLLGDWLTQPLQNRGVTDLEKQFKISGPEETIIAASQIEAEEETEKTLENVPENENHFESRLSNLFSEISSISLAGISNEVQEKKPEELNLPGKVENTEKRSLSEDLLLDNEVKKEKLSDNVRKNRIEISTHAAPIYYGNMGTGNFIDPRFDGNNSKGELTYSYGMNISYNLTEKLKIRSGISKVSMSHNTHNIALHAVLNPRSLASIDYKDDLGVRLVNGAITWKGSPERIASAIRSDINDIHEGRLNQTLGFIEVPVEVEYAIIDKKFSINLIGGASTLFLDENTITISSGAISTELGQANNLNEISFSTNVGIGLDYDVSNKFRVNLEPIFKYQINTFDAASGTYQPYYIGIYSGFSYKF